MDDEGGLGPYSAQEFEQLGFAEYRKSFPQETSKLTDAQIWRVVSLADDDHSDDEWRAKFMEAST